MKQPSQVPTQGQIKPTHEHTVSHVQTWSQAQVPTGTQEQTELQAHAGLPEGSARDSSSFGFSKVSRRSRTKEARGVAAFAAGSACGGRSGTKRRRSSMLGGSPTAAWATGPGL